MLKKILVAAFAVVALAACESPRYVTSDVVRFHTLPAAPSGQTFVIATTSAEQGQSLAFRQYADEVTAKLTSMGLRPAPGPTSSADFVVTMNYAIRGPSPDVESEWADWGVGFGYRGGWGHRWGGAGYWGPGRTTYTRQLYIRRVEIDIYRGSTYDTPKRDRVFEGRALSAGQNGQLEPVMPYILDALFKDFPGRSGEPMHVAIEVPPGIADKMPHSESGSEAY